METIVPCLLKRSSNVSTWVIDEIPKSHRIVFSWNGKRHEEPFQLCFSLLYETWTKPQVFCEWGPKFQASFSYDDPLQRFQFFQDELLLLAELPQKIKIEAIHPRQLAIPRFFASFVMTDSFPLFGDFSAPSIELYPKWHYSQMELNLPYSPRICSPISLINASSFFLQTERIDIPSFVAGVYDHTFDIYGNWMLNTAHAAALFPLVEPKVQRLASFHDVIEQLKQGKPVVASISGHLTDAPLPYPHGHLLVIYGWDNEEKKVLCIDSGAETHQTTLVRYNYTEFMESWSKKFHLCYTF